MDIETMKVQAERLLETDAERFDRFLKAAHAMDDAMTTMREAWPMFDPENRARIRERITPLRRIGLDLVMHLDAPETGKRAACLASQWWADRLEQGDKKIFHHHLYYALKKKFAQGMHTVALSIVDDIHDDLLDAVKAAGLIRHGVAFLAEGVLPVNTLMYVLHTSITVFDKANGHVQMPVPQPDGRHPFHYGDLEPGDPYGAYGK